MNTVYLLVILTNSLHMPVQFQEFTSKETCQEVLKVIHDEYYIEGDGKKRGWAKPEREELKGILCKPK